MLLRIVAWSAWALIVQGAVTNVEVTERADLPIAGYERIGGKSGKYCQQLDTINADGTNRRRLHAGCYNGWPAWSPNGRKIIAYRSGPVQPGLWRMSPNGSHQHFITLGYDVDQQPTR